MHAEMRNRSSTIRPWLDRIGVRALVLVSAVAVAVVVLLATAVWLTQPWNSGTDQSILPVGPDLDKNWCENADGHYHNLGPVMEVMYGLPGSTDRIRDPPPGHSLQVMEIACVPENWKQGTKGTIVWMSPDSPWYYGGEEQGE